MKFNSARGLLLCIVLSASVSVAWAGEGAGAFDSTWISTCGSGSANVFDGGGPHVSEYACGSGSIDQASGFIISQSDFTQPGSGGAGAIASGGVDVSNFIDDLLGIRVDLLTGYFPSFSPGGDNPGGTAEGELLSIIEFEMPADTLEWEYRLDIDNLQPNPFTGSTSIVVENVTQSQTLLELDSETPNVATILRGAQGDLIRITSQMMGQGSMGPGSQKIYASEFRTQFTVPEPRALGMFIAGLACTFLRRRRRLS